MTNPGMNCRNCAAPLGRDASFCHRCGARADTRRARGEGLAWAVAGGLVVVTLVVLLATRSGGGPAASVGGGSQAPELTGRAPDISGLSPRQQFDRLYERVMAAAADGDTATMVRLSEHALQAYAQLDSLDADARYHAAILAAQIGGFPAALALADSILAADPNHLFGYLIRGTVANLAGDATALATAQTAFLRAWPSESARGRTEYLDHQTILDQFRQAATAASPGPP